MGNPTRVDAMERRRIDQAVADYLTRTKSWRPAEYRIEHRRLSDDGTHAIVWAVFLKDEVNPVPGGGQSLELHVDRKTRKIVKELGFQ
jgi:hypothetical protein